MRQFIGEAVVLSVVGLGAGCALAALLLPAFNATFSQELSLGLSEPSMLGALAALLLLVSLGAGWYPALMLSRSRRFERDSAQCVHGRDCSV